MNKHEINQLMFKLQNKLIKTNKEPETRKNIKKTKKLSEILLKLHEKISGSYEPEKPQVVTIPISIPKETHCDLYRKTMQTKANSALEKISKMNPLVYGEFEIILCPSCSYKTFVIMTMPTNVSWADCLTCKYSII